MLKKSSKILRFALRTRRWRTTRRAFSEKISEEKISEEERKKINVRAPEDLADTMRVNQWYFEKHDFVEKNEGLCEIETEDFVADVPCPQDGFLSKIHVSAGTKGVKADTLLCELVRNREDLVSNVEETKEEEKNQGGRDVFEDVSAVRDLPLETFMKRLKLDVYLPRMKDEGFDDLVDLVAFSEEEMDFFVRDVEMKPGHAIRLRHGIQQAKRLEED